MVLMRWQPTIRRPGAAFCTSARTWVSFEKGERDGRAHIESLASSVAMRPIFLVLLCILSVAAVAAKEKPPTLYSIPVPPQPDYSELDWLVGEWSGKTTDRSPQGEVRLSASFDLEKRFMVLRGEVSLAATKSAPASRESWMGILSASQARSVYVLRTFSSTGFISRYRVVADGPEISFNPEGGELPPPGWLFRRVIRRTGVDEFAETLQAAPPAKPFFDHYTAKLSRVSRGEKTGSEPGSTR